MGTLLAAKVTATELFSRETAVSLAFEATYRESFKGNMNENHLVATNGMGTVEV